MTHVKNIIICIAAAAALVAVCGVVSLAWLPSAALAVGPEAGAVAEEDQQGTPALPEDLAIESGKGVQHAPGTLVVCIDPGHGGSETGAAANGLKEKELNLKIALALRDELNTYKGVIAIMTRTNDTYVGLDERPAYAALNGADLFISIHCNAGGNSNGFEVWVPNWSTYNATQRNRAHSLAYKVLEELAEFGRTNRGVKTRNATWNAYYPDGYPQDYYAVIRGARQRGIAGLLVEHCFIDQAGDAALLSDDNNLRRMGIDDARAIAREYGLKKRDSSATGSFKRKGGYNALGTMVEIVKTGFANGSCKTALLANLDSYWDALSASSLAGVKSCPVLLTHKDSLDTKTKDELVRLGVKNVYLIGGEAVLSKSLEKQLKGMGIEVTRLWGYSAAGTARAIYQEGFKLAAAEQSNDASAAGSAALGRDILANRVAAPAPSSGSSKNASAAQASVWADTAIIATSQGYWDSLSASPYAYAKKAPIFLADIAASGKGRILSASTLEAVKNGGFQRIIICGGPEAVSNEVTSQLASAGYSSSKIKRLAGYSAISTSSAIATFCLQEGMHANRMAIATANGHWDALTGAALCGKNNAPLVLVSGSNISTITGFVSNNRSQITTGYIFGGPDAVSVSIEKVANQALVK